MDIKEKLNNSDIDKKRNAIISHGAVPEHIAIIMDGNGRWAKKRGKNRLFGHKEGINSVREITRECGALGVKALTLYTFSVENWSRPIQEVSALMTLLLSTIRKEINELHKNNVKLTIMGHLGDLPEKSLKGLQNGVEVTKNNTGLNLNLALSYGSRQEILNATKVIARDVKRGSLKEEDITAEVFSNYLYTKNMPDPDLLIRTSGELRLSNFLLWQIAYAELYVTSVFWPDFRALELFKAISDYQRRERRFGLTSEQIHKKNKGK